MNLADENGVSEYLLQNVRSHFFKHLKEEIANPKVDKIHIQEFGKFKVNHRVVRYIILAHVKQAKELKLKGENYDKYKDKIKRLWKLKGNIWNT